MKKVCLVCDYLLTRNAYAKALSSLDEVELIFEFDKFSDCVDFLSTKSADIVLIDIQLGKREFETLKRLQDKSQKTKFIVIAEQENFLQVMALGAAYVLKNMLLDEFVAVIETILRGNMFIASEVVDYVTELFQEKLKRSCCGNNDYELSEREVGILIRIAKGMSNSQIGNELALSQFTVKNYVSQIISKLQVTTRTEAATKAIQIGLI